MPTVDRARLVVSVPPEVVDLIDRLRLPGQSRSGWVLDVLLDVLAPLHPDDVAAIRRSATVQPTTPPPLPPGPPLLPPPP